MYLIRYRVKHADSLRQNSGQLQGDREARHRRRRQHSQNCKRGKMRRLSYGKRQPFAPCRLLCRRQRVKISVKVFDYRLDYAVRSFGGSFRVLSRKRKYYRHPKCDSAPQESFDYLIFFHFSLTFFYIRGIIYFEYSIYEKRFAVNQCTEILRAFAEKLPVYNIAY